MVHRIFSLLRHAAVVCIVYFVLEYFQLCCRKINKVRECDVHEKHFSKITKRRNVHQINIQYSGEQSC